LHVMRDHPFHGALILGGTYGIYQRNESMVNIFEEKRRSMIRERLFNDQYNLAVLKWDGVYNFIATKAIIIEIN